MSEAWIIDACRTPRGIGKKGKGALAEQHPQHLGATVLKAIAERNDVNTADVGDVIFGTSSQRGVQSGDLARMAALDAGYDVKASGVTLDRFCGSGISSVQLAAMNILSGTEDVAIGGKGRACAGCCLNPRGDGWQAAGGPDKDQEIVDRFGQDNFFK